jgi:hypothetical protein
LQNGAIVEPSEIQQSWQIYNQAEPEYERYYYDEDSGGFVLIHQDHNTIEGICKTGKKLQ